MTDAESAAAIATTVRPMTEDNRETWRAYWQAQGQLWRTVPEITAERQAYLAERRAIPPDIEQSVYPFKGITPRLTRADVEWLLATHEEGRGPLDWDEEKDKPKDERRVGLDLRGADLRSDTDGLGVDLRGLPLAGLHGGLTFDEWFGATEEQRAAAALHLEGASLAGAHLERAILHGAHLADAFLGEAHLETLYVNTL